MIQLSVTAMHQTIARFPPVRLAYETQMIPTDPDNVLHDVCFAIPKGNRRFFMWLDTVSGTPVLSFLEPTPAHKIRSVYQIPMAGITENKQNKEKDLWSGTVVSGYLVDMEGGGGGGSTDQTSGSLFVVDDVHMLLSVVYGTIPPIEKTGALLQFFEMYNQPQNRLLRHPDMPVVVLCQFCGFTANTPRTDPMVLSRLCAMPDPIYPVKCLQFRSSTTVAPRANVYATSNANTYTTSSPSNAHKDDATQTVWSTLSAAVSPNTKNVRITDNIMRIFHSVESDLVPKHARTFKQTYNDPRTVFLVQADAMFDVYRLYCVPNGANKVGWVNECTGSSSSTRGPTQTNEKMSVFYQYALVPSYQSSVYMNLLFRNVRANENLDYLEESDDEEEGNEEEECENKKRKYEGSIPENERLHRKLLMECCYDWDRRRWIPHTLVSNDQAGRVVFEGEL